MNVAVLIMSTNAEPSIRNVSAMKDTFIDYYNSHSEKFDNTYTFYEYCGNTEHTYNNDDDLNVRLVDTNFYKIDVNIRESIYTTFEKTVKVLQFISNVDDEESGRFDWIIRINISSYLNLFVLDEALRIMNKDVIYCNALNTFTGDDKYLNDIYPRGDFYVLSYDMLTKILPSFNNRCLDKELNLDKVFELQIPHVDDCLMGVCIIDSLGKEYVNHLKMVKYNFLPAPDKIHSFNFNCIASRVKTIPPGVTYSGYSWEDNPYRLYDSVKIMAIHKLVCEHDYSNLNFERESNLVENEDTSRPTIFVEHKSVNIASIKSFIKQKRGK